MGLWEEAEAQRAALHQVDDATAVEVRLQQNGLREFADAMRRLGIAPFELPLCYLWRDSNPDSSDYGFRGNGLQVVGWPVASYSRGYSQLPKFRRAYLAVTPDAQLIDTGEQAYPPRKKAFRTPPPIERAYVTAWPFRGANPHYEGGYSSEPEKIVLGDICSDLHRTERDLPIRSTDATGRRIYLSADEPEYTPLDAVLRMSLAGYMRGNPNSH